MHMMQVEMFSKQELARGKFRVKEEKKFKKMK